MVEDIKKKKKNRLFPDMKPSQNVQKHALFKLYKFSEKINGRFYARGQNMRYNAEVLRLWRPHRLTCKMPCLLLSSIFLITHTAC